MSPADVGIVITRRKQYWRKGDIEPALVKDVWAPALLPISLDLALEGLQRYARDQQTDYPPSITQLLACCDTIADERHRTQVRQRQSEDQAVTADAWQKAYAAKELRRAQEQTTDILGATLAAAAHDPWAHGHVEMFELGVARPGRELEAAEFCRKKAAEEGPDAASWSWEAVWYQRMKTARAEDGWPAKEGHRSASK